MCESESNLPDEAYVFMEIVQILMRRNMRPPKHALILRTSYKMTPKI
jgi:hypothetical protein